jgi:hypothetical protein
VAAVFVEHRWLTDFADATERTGGTAISADFVDAEALARELGSPDSGDAGLRPRS